MGYVEVYATKMEQPREQTYWIILNLVQTLLVKSKVKPKKQQNSKNKNPYLSKNNTQNLKMRKYDFTKQQCFVMPTKNKK